MKISKQVPYAQTERDYWWNASDENAHEKVFEAAQFLYERSQTLREAYLQFFRLYTGRNIIGLGGGNFMQTQSRGERIRLNVGKSAVDAATAMIGANRPRPTVLTIGGDYAQRKRAERLTKFANGIFHHRRQWDIGLAVFPSAAVTGTGFELVDRRKNNIAHEFVPSHEMLFDVPSVGLENPRWHIRWKNVPCDALRDQYGEEHDDKLASAVLLDSDTLADESDAYERYVTVFDAVYVPEFGPGRRIKSLSSGVLEDRKVAFNPYARMRWNGIPGFYLGQGAIEELQSIQIEVDYIAAKIQRLMTFATSIILKRRGTNVAQITNQDWAGYEFSGEPPTFQNINAVSGEYFTHLDRLYQRAFEIVGVSQLAAQSQKPKGLDSGEALRVYNDIGTKRFQHTAQRWEEFHMEIARRDIETARAIAKDGDISVVTGDNEDIEEINFKDCDIERDKYLLRIRPTSILPDEPAGKVEMLKVLAQVVSQTVGPAAGIQVLNLMATVPDLESALKEYNAPRELAEKMVDLILEKGKPQSPFPAMDLVQTRSIATRARCQAAVDKVPQDRLDMLDAFIEQVDAMMSAAAPIPPSPDAAQPPPPTEALSPMPELQTGPLQQ